MAGKRYALVGTGARGMTSFAQPLMNDFPDTAELVGLYDPNPLRLASAAKMLTPSPPTFTDFRQMLSQTDADAVVITGRDCTHAEYVVQTLRAGKRAISEKPLCTTAEQCRDILAAEKESTATCLVTHNVRYGAAEERIKRIIQSGRLGDIRFIQFEETLDRCHGADYFRRWHRRKENSGGLMVHKASHHFDFLNWLADSLPKRLIAHGGLRFYGSNGPFRSRRCKDCPHAGECEFHADLFQRDLYRELYLQAESADGYLRDGCVFDESIDIEDQAAVMIEYESGLEVSYTLLAYSPQEIQRIVIEGQLGRLEYFSCANTGFALGGQRLPGVEELARESLRLYIPGEGVEELDIHRAEGGHGGADPLLRQDFFARDWNREPTDQMASVQEAVQAVLVGAAANESIRTGQPVDIQALLEAP